MLTLHCGANAMTRSEIENLPTPDVQGPRHVVRPYAEDINMLTDYMVRKGVTIQDEAFAVKWKENLPAQFFGAMEVSIPGVEHTEDHALMVGIRGSYDRTLPRSLAVGSRVFVCDNLAFSGEVTMKTRQTINIGERINGLLDEATDSFPQMVEAQNKRFDAYRNYEMRPREGDAAIIEMVRRDVINPSHTKGIVDEWDNPSYQEHAEQGYSLWRLHNAVTEVIKPNNNERANLPQAWERTRKLTHYFDEVVGL